MQACYKILLDIYDDIGSKMTRNGQSYRLFYAKEMVSHSTLHQSNAILTPSTCNKISVFWINMRDFIYLSPPNTLKLEHWCNFMFENELSDEKPSESIFHRGQMVSPKPYTKNGGVHAGCINKHWFEIAIDDLVSGNGGYRNKRCFWLDVIQWPQDCEGFGSNLPAHGWHCRTRGIF